MEFDELQIASSVVVPWLEGRILGIDREVAAKFKQGKLTPEVINELYLRRRLLNEEISYLVLKTEDAR